jgi:NAD(P)-dependent dehydrogenase (short-subunit alcohol dehydrogenase family)
MLESRHESPRAICATEALIARDGSRLAALAASIAAVGGTATCAADLSDHATVRRVMATIAAEHGRPTVLVWNAAQRDETPALSLDPLALDRQMRLGLTAGLTAIQTVAPAMAAGGGGSILMTGGGLSLMPQYGTAVPGLPAVKSALRGFVHASAHGFAARGLRLGTVIIAGQVASGGPFDPDRIAEAFWAMHAAETGVVEHVFDGT